MPSPDPASIRPILVELLAPGAPVPRARLLHEVAERFGIDPRQRKLRAQVAHELRALEAEGRIVDGGPSVWLVQR